MTDPATTDSGKKGKRPTHAAYSVREYGNNQNGWLKLGVAWRRRRRSSCGRRHNAVSSRKIQSGSGWLGASMPFSFRISAAA
jgi:hypothetical protein